MADDEAAIPSLSSSANAVTIERNCSNCNCSNISIMQLFHELKQRFPTVPDLIVSKVIQENCHDKAACETILQQESRNYTPMQCYPGALISGNNTSRQMQMQKKCTNIHHPNNCDDDNDGSVVGSVGGEKTDIEKVIDDVGSQKQQIDDVVAENKPNPHESRPSVAMGALDLPQSHSCDDEVIENRLRGVSIPECNRCCCCRHHDRKCVTNDSDCVARIRERPQTLNLPEVSASSSFPTTAADYQIAVECAVVCTPSPPSQHCDHGGKDACSGEDRTEHRSFTSVNLTLRPPSSPSDASFPIEICSGQCLTYSTASYDPRQGFQSHLQIRIGPSGGCLSAGRMRFPTHAPLSSPTVIRTRTYCRSPCPSNAKCHSIPHIKVLLQKQRERKDLLAVELRKEREKLRGMQSQVQAMQTTLANKPSPLLLAKLKGDIDRLRKECERLTVAVDMYAVSDQRQRHLPLGETDEQFYRNIYTGQAHSNHHQHHHESIIKEQRGTGDGDEGGGGGGPIEGVIDSGSWNCRVCTFRNHPLLTVCEQCEMPRLSLGTGTAKQSNNVVPSLPSASDNQFTNSTNHQATADFTT